MKALIFDKKISIAEVPEPVAGPGEALIRVLYSSICNTDLEIVKGYMGFKGILGHEFVGEVVTPGLPLTGQRVVGEINCSCGQCYLCLTGRERHCSHRTVLGIAGRPGVFAEYIVLPTRNLQPVTSNIETHLAVFTEPLAAAIEIFEKIHISPGKPAFIFGAGKLGLLISLVFKMNGCNCTTIDSNPAKVSNARAMGIHAILSGDLNEDDKAEVCVDCTGNPSGLSHAMDHLYPEGTLVLKTTVAEPAPVDLNRIVINEFRVTGSRCGPFGPALRMLPALGPFLNQMVSATCDFDLLPEAFLLASKPEIIKVLIKHH